MMRHSMKFGTKSTSCYVCMMGSDIATASIRFYSIDNVDEALNLCEKDADTKVLYFHYFDNILDAMGHKLLLQSVSVESRSEIAASYNPEHIDLNHLFVENVMYVKNILLNPNVPKISGLYKPTYSTQYKS